MPTNGKVLSTTTQLPKMFMGVNSNNTPWLRNIAVLVLKFEVVDKDTAKVVYVTSDGKAVGKILKNMHNSHGQLPWLEEVDADHVNPLVANTYVPVTALKNPNDDGWHNGFSTFEWDDDYTSETTTG